MVAVDIQLRGLFPETTDEDRESPSILQLREQDFIGRLLHDLGQEPGRKKLRQARAAERSKDGVLRLYQPVHRTFHVVVLQVHCNEPGEPRLDPGRIASAGLVIRRLDDKGRAEAWRRQGGVSLGWRRFEPEETGKAEKPKSREAGEALEEAQREHPDPDVRQRLRYRGNTQVLKHLGLPMVDRAGETEAFSTIYPAPPEVCKAAGKTLLYGVVNVTSNERVETDQEPSTPPFTRDDIRDGIPRLLLSDRGGAALPPTNRQLRSRQDGGIELLLETVDALDQLGVFHDGDQGKPLRELLESIPIYPWALRQLQSEWNVDWDLTLWEVLRECHRVLSGTPGGDPDATPPTPYRLPRSWPEISAAAEEEKAKVAGTGFAITAFLQPVVTEREIIDAFFKVLSSRWQELEPVSNRFDRSGARYRLGAFLEVCDAGGCGSTLVWSQFSEPFEIIPWYESSDVPPVQVELPELNKESLSQLKPNVAFKVPASLKRFLDGMGLDALDKGEVEPSKWGIGWLCGFNIPIITLCAFIVLYIFLGLLHLLFWWLPFVRVCIPFPKKEG